MKKIIYLLIPVLFFFLACNSDDDESRELRNSYVDISDFTMIKGSPQGGVEIEFNNLKNKDLVNRYLGRVYNERLYRNVTMEFNGDRMTYVDNGYQTISFHSQINDSLFILNADTLRFVALVDNNKLYRRQGLISYPYTEGRDTIRAFGEEMTLAKVLRFSGYNSIESMTNPTDTIIWCNVIYPFE